MTIRYKLWYPIASAISLLFGGTTYVFAPLIARAVREDGNLPWPLRLCQTFDATCFEGRKPQYGFVGTDTEAATYWLRRNPGYGMDYYLLGIRFVYNEWTTEWDGVHFKAKSTKGAFCYTGVWKGWRYKFGWKVWNMFDASTGTWKIHPEWTKGRIPLAFTISR